AARPRGRVPARRGALRCSPAHRRRLGVDGQRLPGIPRLRRIPVQGVLRGVLRARVQGAARRRLLRGPCRLPGNLQELGLPEPAADLRRIPDGPRRGPGLMCRHFAYVGDQVSIKSILLDPPHSLVEQAWAPRWQRHGTMNVDGFGVGWYADGDPSPARYRRAGPIWSDESLLDLARVTRTRAMLCAVRSASVGTDTGAS